jgi:hypothetical protein
MQSFTALLTAAVLAVHAALGCCWHHGHSHPPAMASGSSVPAHGCSHEHGDRHRHDGGHDGAEQEDSPDEESPCGGQCAEGACVFLAGGKPVLPNDGQTEMPVGGLLDVSSEVPYLATWKGTGDVSQALPPPLRSHLAKRVLLI